MRLRRISAGFFTFVVVVLCANALSLLLIRRSYQEVVDAQDHRQSALNLATELQQETEQLTSLVRSYTATGEARYLLYYDDILGVRMGDRPAPRAFNSRSYWDNVIAGRIRHELPVEGTRRSITDRMKAQGFGPQELASVDRVIEVTGRMNDIEKIAFAATQGLYDPDRKEFVGDGPPRLEYATRLVNSGEYSALRPTSRRRSTTSSCRPMGARVTRSPRPSRCSSAGVFLSMVSMGVTIVLILLAVRVIRQRVLVPIHRLGHGASRLAEGDYATRVDHEGGVEELATLATTMDTMARAIEATSVVAMRSSSSSRPRASRP